MKKLNVHQVAFLLILTIIIPSCEKDEVTDEIVKDPILLAKLYSDSVDTLFLNSNEYILETYLYRDFMPSIPPAKNRPTIAVVFLINCDSLTIPVNLQVEKLYIINNELIWISTPKNNNPSGYPDFKLHLVSYGKGPTWGPNISVDVVLQLTDNSDHKEYFVIAKNQPIGAVY